MAEAGTGEAASDENFCGGCDGAGVDALVSEAAAAAAAADVDGVVDAFMVTVN